MCDCYWRASFSVMVYTKNQEGNMEVENKITTIASHSHCRGLKDRVIMRDWNLKLDNSLRTGKVLKTASVRNPKKR
jgi:hypothetical protein